MKAADKTAKVIERVEAEILARSAVKIPASEWENHVAWVHAPAKVVSALRKLASSTSVMAEPNAQLAGSTQTESGS